MDSQKADAASTRDRLRGSQVSKAKPPNFLYVVLDRTACAPFYTERRIERAEPTKLRRKSGT